MSPLDDGVTHINIYSKGSTRLGRLLSNFAATPFEHPIFGRFESMEGYWYYIKTGFQFDELRLLAGIQAKAVGKEREAQVREESEQGIPTFRHFREAILDGIRCKLRQNQEILTLLQESSLPLTHYYYFGNPINAVVKELPEHQWQVDEIERIRALLRARK